LEVNVEMSLGDNIKNRRMQKKMTQVELAERTIIPQSVISDIENNKRKHGVSSEHLKKIARSLGCKVAELIDDEDETKPA
jgi:transcriptional regulator with XRE-family HTH domain